MKASWARAALWLLCAPASVYCLLAHLPSKYMEGFWPAWVETALRLHPGVRLSAALTAPSSFMAAACAWWLPLVVWELAAARRTRGARATTGSQWAAFPAAALLLWAAHSVWALPSAPEAALSAVLWSLALSLAGGLAAAAAASLGGARTGAVFAGAVCWRALDVFFLAPVGLTGPPAWLFGGLASAAAALGLSAEAGAKYPARPRLASAVALGAAVGAAAFGAAVESAADWSHAGQALGLVALWALAGEALRRALPPVPARLAASLTLGLCAASGGLAAAAAGSGLSPALRGWEAVEPGFRTARRFWTVGPGGTYDWLRRQSFPGRRLAPEPVSIPLVVDPVPVAGPKPHIVVLVLDSLRRDHVGAFEPSFKGTPALDRFAREAAVFRRAFTPYAGTVLAEPALWTGTLLPHRELAAPFYPFNALQQLADLDGYRVLLAEDTLLRAIVRRDERVESVGAGALGRNRLCAFAEVLDRRLARKTSEPLLIFGQVHDVHLAVLRDDLPEREPRAAYSKGVAGLDACFGRFVEVLRRRGVYDDAVLVVTSDHGDSLGEEGRWGHATLAPEVMRVPLLARLPRRLRAEWRYAPDAPVSLLDVAPTLYALLGHGPPVERAESGRSLFHRGAAPPPRERLLVASSYAPAFGFVDRAGTVLFTADAVDRRSRLFDLEAGRDADLPPELERRYHEDLRAALERLHALYGLPIR